MMSLLPAPKASEVAQRKAGLKAQGGHYRERVTGSGEPFVRPGYEGAEANENAAGSGAAGGHAVGDVHGLGHEGFSFESEQIVNELDAVKRHALTSPSMVNPPKMIMQLSFFTLRSG